MINIPQFGSIESVCRVPNILIDNGFECMNYAQMGFALKGDINASLEANTKFGENHGKAASILGIASCKNKRIYKSDFSLAFYNLDPLDQYDLVTRLFFKIPIVQGLLKLSKEGEVNGYSLMDEMTDSTKKRRGQCLRAIFKHLKSFDNDSLNDRINNIVWRI